MSIILETAGKMVIKEAVKRMIEAYQKRQAFRVNQFFNFVDVAIDSLNEKDAQQLNEYIDTEEGIELLAAFADSITTSCSKRAHMALALAYCHDRDLKFDDLDEKIFASAIKSIDDVTIDFFLKCCTLETQESNNTPYPRACINNTNYADFDFNNWKQAGVNICVNDLIQRRLLLPDPAVGAFNSAGEAGWAVWFGLTSKSHKYASAFKKADMLLKL